MKYPKLVRHAKTPIHISIVGEETNEFGEEEIVLDGDFLCNYQGKAFQKYLSDKVTVTITGIALIDGDICPNVGEITGGKAFLFGEERNINIGSKCRNPDGTVNYTRLELE